ncbi:MAG: polysaccharide export protein [Carboxylicivirga sp.]|jgi:polysaccharide export outer membrane protein|nr:polysaccharide export protein [Carboxylicivirga sp.]
MSLKLVTNSRILSFFLLLNISLTSCLTLGSIEYLQDESDDKICFDEPEMEILRVKPYDDLFVQISSLDDVTSNVFTNTNAQQSMQMGSMSAYGASLISYTIDKDGYLNLPVIGKLHVDGRSLAEISKLIEKELNNILNRPVVSVKLVNRYVSILGEVRNPGHFTYSQEKLTIYDALGLAGDMTNFGDRRQVILTRNKEGKNCRVCIDLTKSDVLASEYYFVRPNDMIYVKPMGRRFWGLDRFPYTVILSTVTVGLLMYTAINQ